MNLEQINRFIFNAWLWLNTWREGSQHCALLVAYVGFPYARGGRDMTEGAADACSTCT